MNSNLSYNDIFEFNICLMKTIIKEYGTDQKAWMRLSEFYIDPDGYPLKNGEYKILGNVKCTIDGLLSINRINKHEHFGLDFVNTYETYRKTPIIFFPPEKHFKGINVQRSRIFGDRIDHTLYDLKRKCEKKTDCKLDLSYNQPNTKKWLENLNYDFDKIVDLWGIKGIFVDEKNNEIYDLEYNNGKTINEYCNKPEYTLEWSDTYYNNIKGKIRAFEMKNVK